MPPATKVWKCQNKVFFSDLFQKPAAGRIQQFQFWENTLLEGNQTILVWIETPNDSGLVIETPDQDGLATLIAATLTARNLCQN